MEWRSVLIMGYFHSVFKLSHVLRHLLACPCFFLSGCSIVSVDSPSASTLNVKWSSYSMATVYLLDLRVVNSTTIAPVVVMTTAPNTGRLVQGLQPGHHYQITMKVFEYTTVVCTNVTEAMTGKKK